jgi:hypothetical protein
LHLTCLGFFALLILLDVLLISWLIFDRLDISIEEIYSKRAGKEIPMLSVIDDGHGMIHREVEKMVRFGHKKPEADDPDRIGRFGVGFKVAFLAFMFAVLVLNCCKCL